MKPTMRLRYLTLVDNLMPTVTEVKARQQARNLGLLDAKKHLINASPTKLQQWFSFGYDLDDPDDVGEWRNIEHVFEKR